MAFLTYALDKRGKLVYIDDVTNGLKCGCYCPNPECNAPLNARNGGEIRVHHFAHANEYECKGAFESQLHLLAKEILQETGQIMLPDSDNENYPSGLVKIHSVEVEKYDKHYNFKPDVEGIMENGERLLIEFLVSHSVRDEKRQTIIDNNLKCVEIDINYQSIYKPKLKEFLVGSSSNRKWILPESNTPKKERDAIFYSKTRNPLYEAARDALKEIFDKGTLIIHPFYNVPGRIDVPFDLRKYRYDICKVGTDFNRFKSDLLIYRSQEKDKGYISINILGRRRSKKFTYPFDLRVIDIVLSSYASINNIKGSWEKGNLTTSMYAKFYYSGFIDNRHETLISQNRQINIVSIEKNLTERANNKIISQEDIKRARAFIDSRSWRYFKNSEFTRKLDKVDIDEFKWFAMFIKTHGLSNSKKIKDSTRFEWCFDGYRYWWVGDTIESCTLINRNK